MSRSREKGWERKRKGKGVEQEQEQEQGQGQRREQGREPGREPGQKQAGQAAGGGLFVCARKGAGDHQIRGGWGPSSHLVLAVKGWCCAAYRCQRIEGKHEFGRPGRGHLSGQVSRMRRRRAEEECSEKNLGDLIEATCQVRPPTYGCQ